MKNLLLLSIILFCTKVSALEQSGSTLNQTQHHDIEKQIQSLLDNHNTPGVAVTIISSEGTPWLNTFGYADLEAERKVDGTTRFRVGSVAKMLIALSVMKLAEQGNLHLTDKLSEIAPEIEFTNPWAKTHPVRVADLLAHTTGWDGTHFVENAYNSADPVTLSQALTFHTHSRVSRWAPGTRTAYNNGAPVVAAYLVEKFSGMSYEHFVEKHFFAPLNMLETGYFYSRSYQQNASQQYVGNQPVAYRHLLNRPAGALHASIEDLGKFAHFLLLVSKGKSTILSAESFEKMQHPDHSAAFNAGLEINWGLGLQSFSHNGWIFWGHEGALRGAQALVAIQPESDIAYAIIANTNGPIVGAIHQLIADHLATNRSEHATSLATKLPESFRSLTGYYRPINPISTFSEIISLLRPYRISMEQQLLFIKPVLGGSVRPLAVDEEGNIIQPASGKTVLVQVIDPIVGDVLHYGPNTLQKVSALQALGPILLLITWIVLSLSVLLFAPVWITRLFTKSLKPGTQLWVRLSPFATVLTVTALLLVIKSLFNDTFPERLLGNASLHSVSITLLTLVYAMLSVVNFFPLLRYKRERMNRVMYWFNGLFSLVNLLILMVLLACGMIGIRTWVY